MNKIRAPLIAVLLLGIICLIGCGKKDSGVPTILVVHSYHAEYDWVVNVNKGFEQAFEKIGWIEGTDYDFEIHYMDTKRNPDNAFMEKSGDEAVALIDEMKPDVVIIVADNAMEHCAVKLLDREDELPVVFCAVNQDPVAYYKVADSLKKPGHNISGCLHVAYFKNSVDILREMAPGVSRCAFLYDDATVAPPHIKRAIEEAPAIGVEVVTDRSFSSFEEWKAVVLDANTNADFIHLSVYHTMKDNAGNHVLGKDVLAWTIENATIPTIAVWAFTVDGGALCGELITGEEHAKAAIEMAVKVINGVPVGSIPINENVMGIRKINATTAEKLGLDISESLKISCEIIK